MKNSNIFITLIVIISFLGCSEDTIDDTGLGTITGSVVREGTNEPVENAKISTNPSSSTVFTDENGEFILANIPAGDYSVEARKEGLLTQFEAASVLANTRINVIFEMQRETAGNKPPTTPEAIYPIDNAEGVALTTDFKWSATDPEEDELIYDVEIRNEQDEEILLFEDITDTTFTVEGLNANSKYFWQVSASDEVNPEVLSPIYSFTTADFPEGRILFTRTIGGNNVIFSRDNDGNEYALTPANWNSFRPRKNPASRKIAFLRTTGGETHLYTMNLDGSQQKQITSSVPVSGFNLNQIDFAWSSDGAALLYPHFNKLYKVNATGGGTNLLFATQSGKFITELDVSEDGKTIALATNNSNGYNASIYTINSDGEVLDQVLSNVPGAVGGLDLSVNGDLLLYSHDVSGFQNDSYRRLDSRLFLYNLVNGTTMDLSVGKVEGTNDLDPRFSPNEAEVIFVNTSNDGISQKNVFTVQIEGGNGDEDNRSLLIENAFMPDWE